MSSEDTRKRAFYSARKSLLEWVREELKREARAEECPGDLPPGQLTPEQSRMIAGLLDTLIVELSGDALIVELSGDRQDFWEWINANYDLSEDGDIQAWIDHWTAEGGRR